MKIAINAIPLLSPLTGIGRYAYEVSKALRLIDAENEYSYFYGYFSEDLIAPGASGPGARYRLKEAVKKIPIAGSLARRLVLNAAGGKEFDLYFEPNFIPINVRSKRTVATIADFSFHVHPEWHPKDRTDYFRNYFWKNIKRADRIIVISDFIKRSAIEFGFSAELLRTVHLGFDRAVYRVRADEEVKLLRRKFGLPENFILFVGSIEPRKNLVRLIQSYLSLDLRLRKEFKLVLVGFKGWDNRDLMGLLLAAKDEIMYTGYVSEEELAGIYNLATLFVYPTLYEGFGLPPLEAMACGCSVLTSNIASLPEVCGDAAFYADPLSIESMAEGMQALLSDPALRGDFRRKGLARSALFSWEKTAREHLQVFQECCNS